MKSSEYGANGSWYRSFDPETNAACVVWCNESLTLCGYEFGQGEDFDPEVQPPTVDVVELGNDCFPDEAKGFMTMTAIGFELLRRHVNSLQAA